MKISKKILLVIYLTIILVTNLQAQFTKLFDFNGTTNGAYPIGSPISDGNFLYGMAGGGVANKGIIFRIKPDGTGDTVLFNFSNATGINPGGDLYYDGTFLYGVTSQGAGGYSATYPNGCGSVFKIKTDGTGFVKLHTFMGSPDGATPLGSLISDGTFLYGMTSGGGGNPTYGTIFKIMPSGTGFAVLMNFNGTNGFYPHSSLVYDGIYLYGMTQMGGANSDGVIFKIMPNGTGFVDLLNFAGTTNGSSPSGSLVSDGTFLYGMTATGGSNTTNCSSGCGVIFKIKPDGTGYDTLRNFNHASGSNPQGSLIYDGIFLYGMAGAGGSTNNGVVFKIKPDGTGYDTLVNFTGIGGRGPTYCSLLLNGGCLYGMTSTGGIDSSGTIFSYCLSGAGVKQTISSNEQIIIYPNPTKDILNIKYFGLNENTEVRIQTVLGEEVRIETLDTRSNKVNIDVSNFKEGIYFINLKTTKEVLTKKLIIQR